MICRLEHSLGQFLRMDSLTRLLMRHYRMVSTQGGMTKVPKRIDRANEAWNGHKYPHVIRS